VIRASPARVGLAFLWPVKTALGAGGVEARFSAGCNYSVGFL